MEWGRCDIRGIGAARIALAWSLDTHGIFWRVRDAFFLLLAVTGMPLSCGCLCPLRLPLCGATRLVCFAQGAYGVVVSATDTRTGEEVAIKRIVCVFDEPGESTRILRELKFLRLLSAHPNVITLRDVLIPAEPTTFNDVFLVFELLPSDLSRVLRCSHLVKLSMAHKRSIMFQLLRGVAFLHASAVFHRDIKASNVLLDDECQVRICDFGLARALLPGSPIPAAGGPAWTDYVATRWYRAPELLLSPAAVAYSTAIDVWSVGCIFAELLADGAPLFPGVDRQDMILRMSALLGVPSQAYIARVADGAARRFLAALPPPPPVGRRRHRRSAGSTSRRGSRVAGTSPEAAGAAAADAAAATVTAPPRTACDGHPRPPPRIDVEGGLQPPLPLLSVQADSSDADTEQRASGSGRGGTAAASSDADDDEDDDLVDGDGGANADASTPTPGDRPLWYPPTDTLDRLARVLPLDTPPAAVRIAASLLTFDAAARPAAADVLADPWFAPLAAASVAAGEPPPPERVVLPPAEFAFEGSGGGGKRRLRALFMEEMLQHTSVGRPAAVSPLGEGAAVVGGVVDSNISVGGRAEGSPAAVVGDRDVRLELGGCSSEEPPQGEADALLP